MFTFALLGCFFGRKKMHVRLLWRPTGHNIAKNAYCSRDIYLQLERSVITLVIIHSTQKKLIHWLL